MGRKRKNTEDVKISKTIRLKQTHWQMIEDEHKRLGNRYFITTIEHIITKYFTK